MAKRHLSPLFWLRRKLARTFNSAINFKNRIRGLGKNHKTPVFPKLVFTIKKGVNQNEQDPNYDIKNWH